MQNILDIGLNGKVALYFYLINIILQLLISILKVLILV